MCSGAHLPGTSSSHITTYLPEALQERQLTMSLPSNEAPVATTTLWRLRMQRTVIVKKWRAFSERVLTWKVLSMMALLVNLNSAICMFLAYERGEWEIITHDETTVESDIPVSTRTDPDYFILSYNQSASSMEEEIIAEDGVVNLAISKTIVNGIFKRCDTISSETKSQLEQEGVKWLTEGCFKYSSTGPSEFTFNSPRYFQHSITRMSQTCLFVSAICLIATLITGAISLAFGQLLLCIAISTLSIAAAIYQMFIGVTVLVRMDNDSETIISHSITTTETLKIFTTAKAGFSVWCIWIACVLSMFTGLLWVAVYKRLSKHANLLEATNNNGSYAKYNYCCSL